MSKRTLIIAEAGVNHNGSLERAKEMIKVASSCGADYIKFQIFKAEEISTATASKAPYQIESSSFDQSQQAMLKNLELTESEYIEILDYCAKSSIKCFSTAFDLGSLRFLESVDQNLYKIPSGEITNLPYLEYIGSLRKEVILSTGMSSMEDIERAFKVLIDSGTTKDNISILHCTSQYPAPIDELNLTAMHSIKEEFDVRVGYSDHSEGIHIAIAAVSLGATILEKHFTLDKDLTGPDHKASIDPIELENMIKAVRDVDLAMGDGKKYPMPSELMNLNVIRKSIVAKALIKEGDIFNINNITCKRPAEGITPMEWHEVLGKRAKQNFEIDDLIVL